MNCPGCGAGVSRAMVEAGECGYCHTAIQNPASSHDATNNLAKAVEKLAQAQVQAQPQVVHVTRVEVHAPAVYETSHRSIPLGARIAGCFSGCLSAGISLAITALTFGIIGWQLWLQSRSFPTPSPAPAPAADAPASQQPEHEHEHGTRPGSGGQPKPAPKRRR